MTRKNKRRRNEEQRRDAQGVLVATDNTEQQQRLSKDSGSLRRQEIIVAAAEDDSASRAVTLYPGWVWPAAPKRGLEAGSGNQLGNSGGWGHGTGTILPTVGIKR
ncbi:uncharacterized protein BDCG_01268 [Blastomyces dermatitidis ER-3]|uniref:BZIP domain-containing protein n=1 Tax=Ajellomyces dermatitidis (strain ER-3 / ATCC MYA-2586) TaxID=559297 RepID=A0ABM9YFL1_AJEDR|nr:uncharacterized protein BDCG_01268 [Blastomyces dermatitidis ER-3]EEQ84463.1 hypothetical protein BDCG_01268 [Blastomyces dermatitidis ER-3]